MKKFSSRFAAVLAALFVLITLAACGSDAVNSGAATGSGSANATFKVGLIQLVEHPSLNEIRDAFTARLEAQAAAAGIEVEIIYKNAQNDPSLINSISRQFVDDKVDAIVAIATPAAQGAAAVTQDIPIIFSAITDPVGAGLVSDLQSPSGNITGTSDAIPVEKIFELADELTPGIETYGLIYNAGEDNSVSVIAQTKAYLESKGLKYEEVTVTSAGEVQLASRSLLERVDAVFAPIDNTVADGMQALAAEGISAQKPVYVAADSMVRDGGLATVGVNYTELGEKTADMTLQVLQGENPGAIPVAVLEDFSVTVNPDTAAALGVDVSRYTA